jgi:hypothetical protein
LRVLVIASLVSLLLIFVYSRLRPYIQLVQKLLGTVRTVADSQSTTGRRGAAKVDGKLVRCVSCGTWIPAARAIGPRASLASYCSRECLEKSSAADKRKAAG